MGARAAASSGNKALSLFFYKLFDLLEEGKGYKEKGKGARVCARTL